MTKNFITAPFAFGFSNSAGTLKFSAIFVYSICGCGSSYSIKLTLSD